MMMTVMHSSPVKISSYISTGAVINFVGEKIHSQTVAKRYRTETERGFLIYIESVQQNGTFILDGYVHRDFQHEPEIT